MSIRFDEKHRAITIHTGRSTYQMQVDRLGHLHHLYYGGRVGEEDVLDQLLKFTDCGFSPNYYEQRHQRSVSPDTFYQEYTGCNHGDYRISSLEVWGENGGCSAEFVYDRHEIRPGKYQIPGLPALFEEHPGEAETLVICLKDPVTGLELELYYGVFSALDIITRSARLVNRGEGKLVLTKAASLCLDFPFGKWDMIHFPGRHCMERQVERRHLNHSITSVESTRGASSHQQNPFIILCTEDTGEYYGSCYGMMLVYSGSHKTQVELDQMGSVRVVMGIQDQQFAWNLLPGEAFDTPEVILAYSEEGLGHLSHQYHRAIRHNLCRSKFSLQPRPVLINNWEATYFDFDSEKLFSIAKRASELGVEMMVLDDGWFGKRDDDNSGLGDWYVNEGKLPGGLAPLIQRIHGLGMKFGLWVEPEMVSEDSDLYRTHPEWALQVPGRKPIMGRNQLVLDLSRRDVVDYLYEVFAELLRAHRIDYIKWDMNRHLTDVFSAALPPERQGEVHHRYVLGLYDLLDRLTSDFPDVLFEGCSGGGGRFDAGMLAYHPQIWCSDDTDAIERLFIQYGTSFGYPISAVGSHVSACPNHQTGRITHLDTRAVVAMSGTFGYELDLNKLSVREKEKVRQQIRRYHRYAPLIQNGSYYRITQPSKDRYYTAWLFVAEDRSSALVNIVVNHPEANPTPIHFWLRGLDPDAMYRIETVDMFASHVPEDIRYNPAGDGGHPPLSGRALMRAGFSIPRMYGDYPSAQILLVRI